MLKFKQMIPCPLDLADDNNCTVRALMIAANMSYFDAYTILANAGRPHGEGFSMRSFLHNRNILGEYALQRVLHSTLNPPLISQLYSPRFTNRSIVITDEHVTAIVNSYVVDTGNSIMNMPIRALYTLTAW